MLRQILVFIGVIVVINAIAYLFNLPFHISIIGSLIASVLVTVIMAMLAGRPRT